VAVVTTLVCATVAFPTTDEMTPPSTDEVDVILAELKNCSLLENSSDRLECNSEKGNML
jgi:hypothetical protein